MRSDFADAKGGAWILRRLRGSGFELDAGGGTALHPAYSATQDRSGSARGAPSDTHVVRRWYVAARWDSCRGAESERECLPASLGRSPRGPDALGRVKEGPDVGSREPELMVLRTGFVTPERLVCLFLAAWSARCLDHLYGRFATEHQCQACVVRGEHERVVA